MVHSMRKELPQIPQIAQVGPQRVLIYNKETGEEFERWPIDAREMLATGSYQMHPVGEEAPEPQTEPQQPHVAAAEKALEHDPHAVMQKAQERRDREKADAEAAEVAKAKPASAPPVKKGPARTSRATAKKKATSGKKAPARTSRATANAKKKGAPKKGK